MDARTKSEASNRYHLSFATRVTASGRWKKSRQIEFTEGAGREVGETAENGRSIANDEARKYIYTFDDIYTFRVCIVGCISNSS